MARILIVDDEERIRDSLEMILSYAKHEAVSADRGDAALAQLDAEPVDLVLLDVKLPGKDGLEVLREIQRRPSPPPVVMISGHGTLETAVEATKEGAFDFLSKPLDQERLLLTIRNALENSRLSDENRSLRGEMATEYRILGDGAAMLAVQEKIAKAAPSDARVLITGENGTGKELVARQIHLQSDRSRSPFVDVNCAAIPKELIESELFGHEKGAFTGATGRKAGRFEQASEGTLFLDEIGDMDLSAQAKVLRVLQENRVQRVGGSGAIEVDVRVIAATNKDLSKEVEEGRFREDLFYRLNVIPIHVPALRERREDIPLLASEFLKRFSSRTGRGPKRFSKKPLDLLAGRDWPGNVRELRNVVERLSVLVDGDEISDRDLLANLEPAREVSGLAFEEFESFEAFKQAAEASYLRKMLALNGWNISRTAETIQMQRSNLYKKIEKYGLK